MKTYTSVAKTHRGKSYPDLLTKHDSYVKHMSCTFHLILRHPNLTGCGIFIPITSFRRQDRSRQKQQLFNDHITSILISGGHSIFIFQWSSSCLRSREFASIELPCGGFEDMGACKSIQRMSIQVVYHYIPDDIHRTSFLISSQAKFSFLLNALSPLIYQLISQSSTLLTSCVSDDRVGIRHFTHQN